MLNNEQRRTLAESCANLRASIQELDRALSANVIDGTPFAIVGDHVPTADMLAGMNFEMVLVEDAHGRCFRALDAQPNHFCGVILKSRESAIRSVAFLADAVDSKLQNPRYVHIRDIRQARRDKHAKALAHIESILNDGGAQ